jgi:hypothetical protein
MAKSSLPRIDGTEAVQELKPVEQRSEKTEKQNLIEECYMTSMSYVRRVDVLLPPKHRKILSDKIRQLQDCGATLSDGTEITDKTKAILWILENEVKR